MKNIAVPDEIHQKVREAIATTAGETIGGFTVKAIEGALATTIRKRPSKVAK